MQQRGIIGLGMIGGLGDEDERIERGGVDTEFIEQTRSGIGAEIERGHAWGGDPTLLEPQGLGVALQDGPFNPRGQSVRDIITHDGSRRHGDAGEAEIREGGMHFCLGDKLASGHVDKGRYESIEYGVLSIGRE